MRRRDLRAKAEALVETWRYEASAYSLKSAAEAKRACANDLDAILRDTEAEEVRHGLCGAFHESTGATCQLPAGHMENHRGEYPHGIAQWPLVAVRTDASHEVAGGRVSGDETRERWSERWQKVFWALPPGEMRHRLRSLEIDTGLLRKERAEAMTVLAPNVPESGLVDACRQVKQAAISEADNSHALEEQNRKLREALDEALTQWSWYLSYKDDPTARKHEREDIARYRKLLAEQEG